MADTKDVILECVKNDACIKELQPLIDAITDAILKILGQHNIDTIVLFILGIIGIWFLIKIGKEAFKYFKGSREEKIIKQCNDLIAKCTTAINTCEKSIDYNTNTLASVERLIDNLAVALK